MGVKGEKNMKQSITKEELKDRVQQFYDNMSDEELKERLEQSGILKQQKNEHNEDTAK